MAVGTPRFLEQVDFPAGQRVPLPGGGFIIGTGPASIPFTPTPVGPRGLGNGFGIPTPFGPITIGLPGGCGPLEACSGPTIAGVCLGRCVTQGFNGLPFQDVPGGPGPSPAPLPTQAMPQVGGCPPRPGAVAAVRCETGCHPNKADYFLKNGTLVLKGTRCVRNRRRNPLNPRALDRAISRIGSAQNAVSRLGFKKKAPSRKKRAPASVC